MCATNTDRENDTDKLFGGLKEWKDVPQSSGGGDMLFLVRRIYSLTLDSWSKSESSGLSSRLYLMLVAK